MLVSLEGVPSQATSEILYRFQKKLSLVPGLGFEMPEAGDQKEMSCPYARVLHFYEAVQACSPHCKVALLSKSFYCYRSRSAQAMEAARALNAALLPPVDLHLMMVLAPDPNDAFGDFLASYSWPGVTLAQIHNCEAACLETAKRPDGHPWPAVSYVVPLPPFCGDNPPILDEIAGHLVSMVIMRAAAAASQQTQ